MDASNGDNRYTIVVSIPSSSFSSLSFLTDQPNPVLYSDPDTTGPLSDQGNEQTVVNHEITISAHEGGIHVGKLDEENISEVANNHKPENANPFIAPVINRWIAVLTWFTPYRQLFFLFVCINLTGIILASSDRWPWEKRQATNFVVGNILVAIAIRSEWVLRFIYWVAVKIFRPHVFPIWIRVKVVGILYHIGGVHSGCGLSTLLWLAVASNNQFREANLHHIIPLVALCVCVACVAMTCLSAFPCVRGRHHKNHAVLLKVDKQSASRVGIVSTILFVIMDSLWSVEQQHWDSRASRLITKPALWFLTAIVIMTVFSWITIQKVPVTIYASSEKATIIRVPGGLTSGLHTRVSLGGLREWHIFGSISEGKHADCHYIVAAVQGQFTKMLNVDKPAVLYTKRWKPCGLPYFSRLFKRGVAICTGSGIGAVASTCIQHDDWFLIWIGPNLEETYGKEIMQLVCDKIPEDRRLIYDTRGPLGRPNIVGLLDELHRNWAAEVTLFAGSPEMNKNVMRSCRVLKIPVFGSIWDA